MVKQASTRPIVPAELGHSQIQSKDDSGSRGGPDINLYLGASAAVNTSKV
jgi:hypothetical protein